MPELLQLLQVSILCLLPSKHQRLAPLAVSENERVSRVEHKHNFVVAQACNMGRVVAAAGWEAGLAVVATGGGGTGRCKWRRARLCRNGGWLT